MLFTLVLSFGGFFCFGYYIRHNYSKLAEEDAATQFLFQLYRTEEILKIKLNKAVTENSIKQAFSQREAVGALNRATVFWPRSVPGTAQLPLLCSTGQETTEVNA